MSSRSCFALFFSLALAACGGATDADPPSEAVSADVNDPNVLPTGLYEVKTDAVSCNVNDLFRDGGRVLIVRSPLGRPAAINMPVPARTVPPEAFFATSPRMDFLLDGGEKSFSLKKEYGCEQGTVTRTIKVRAIGETRLAISYREERAGCELGTAPASCTVDYAFTLAERACPSPTAADCTPKKVSLPVGGMMATQEVKCECAPR